MLWLNGCETLLARLSMRNCVRLAFNKRSENIYYILTLTIMAVVFDLLRAIAEY